MIWGNTVGQFVSIPSCEMWEPRRLTPTSNHNRQKTEKIVIDKGPVFTFSFFNTPKRLFWSFFNENRTNNNVKDFLRVILRDDGTGIKYEMRPENPI